MLNTTFDEMDGVSTGLMMRVAVCGWGAVRVEVHESADRGSARREWERSASAEGGHRWPGAEVSEAGRAHEGGGGAAGVTMRSLHRGSAVYRAWCRDSVSCWPAAVRRASRLLSTLFEHFVLTVPLLCSRFACWWYTVKQLCGRSSLELFRLFFASERGPRV